MKKVLILGVNGFVGGYLVEELKRNNYIIYGADMRYKLNEKLDKFYRINILDINEIQDVIEKVVPDYIINLVAISSVKKSWDNPQLTFDINVKGTINLLETVRKLNLNCRILLVGSSEEYGEIDYSKPVNEMSKLNSINPYGISKITQERIARMYVDAYNMDIIMTRSFNHIGAGQSKGFVIPDFVSQIVQIEKGKIEPIIRVGNLSAERDFTDVRDVVKAYILIIEKGNSGESYNVGSGKVVSIQHVLDILLNISKVKIEVEIDKIKFRQVETPKIQCDINKIKKCVNWIPKISLEETLSEVLNFERKNSN